MSRYNTLNDIYMETFIPPIPADATVKGISRSSVRSINSTNPSLWIIKNTLKLFQMFWRLRGLHFLLFLTLQ